MTQALNNPYYEVAQRPPQALAMTVHGMTYHLDTFKKTYRLYQNGRFVASYHHLADILSAFPDAEEV